MTGMSPEPQHARPAGGFDTTILAAWAILILLGGTQVTFNVASALHHPVLRVHGHIVASHSPLTPIPVLAGLGPVLAAVLLSHLAASRSAQLWFRLAVTGVMLCSMAVSIGATVDVTSPVFGAWWRAVLFGIVLDAASLLALWFIMDRHGQKASAAAATEAAEEAVRDAQASILAVQSEAQQAVAEASARASFAVAEAAATGEQLEAARGELATVRAELQGLKSGMNKRRSTPPRTPRRSPAGKGASTPPQDTPGEGVNPDVDTQAEALIILAAEPDISGNELGRRLGVSKSYGCRLKRELAESTPDPEAAEAEQ